MRPDTTIVLRLTPTELTKLEREFRSQRILAIASPHPPHKQGVLEEPNTTWRLDVGMNGQTRHFEWDTRFGEDDPEWGRLWAAISSVRAIVERRPEYRRLPPAEGAYQ